MGRYQVIAEDIRAMEEKLQSLKGSIPDEKYADISERIEAVKRLGVDLPDDFDASRVQEVIEQVVGLQFDNFSDEFVQESSKEIKKAAFLQRLQYVQNYIDVSKDIPAVVKEAEAYWESLQGSYDEFEKAEVQRKLDEVKLAFTLSRIRSANAVDIDSIDVRQSPYLIREGLQGLAESSEISEEDKLLVNSWLGELVDVKSGEIDRTAVEKLLRTPKLWGLLAGVKATELQPVKKTELQVVKSVREKVKRVGEDSEKRKQEITDVCEKYGVSERIVRRLLKSGKKVCIVKWRFGYKPVGVSTKVKTRDYFKEKKQDLVRALIYNNDEKGVLQYDSYCLDRLEEVVFSDSLTSIGLQAFGKCNLATVRLPDKVIKVEAGAFSECRALKTVTLSDSLDVIDFEAFSCTAIVTIKIPDSVTYIGYDAFRRCPIRSIDFGKGIKNIGERAFSGGKLKSIDIPPSVVRIGDCAFRDNPLEEVILHKGQLEYIGSSAFCGTNLQTLDVPENVRVAVNAVEKGVKVRRFDKELSKERKQEQEMSLEELKKQKQELEALLAKMNERLRAMEQAKGNDLQK